MIKVKAKWVGACPRCGEAYGKGTPITLCDGLWICPGCTEAVKASSRRALHQRRERRSKRS